MFLEIPHLLADHDVANPAIMAFAAQRMDADAQAFSRQAFRDWLVEWMNIAHGCPLPCSAGVGRRWG